MKLLIVEDDEKIAKALKRGFVDEYFDVDIAHDGEKGLKMILEEEYDLVILDLMLPKLNGINVLRGARKRKILIPIIILTAKDAVSDKVDGLNIGADDYLPKPFAFDELLARVKAQLRRAQSHQQILEIDSLKLDPYAFKAERNGTALDLSKTEFKILEYLMSHRGQVMTERQIIAHVWGNNDGGVSNIIAAHIKNIRGKVDKPFANSMQLLKTVRGVGYKIDE
jgi:DNA-binding response OmpR family regulator